MKRLIAAGVLAFAGIASAQTVGVHLVSYHFHNEHVAGFPNSELWNNQNYGIYFRSESGLTIGRYFNSRRMWSNYAGYTMGDQFALTLGIVSGYDRVTQGQGDYTANRCFGPYNCHDVHLKKIILPMIAPSVKVPLTDHFALRLSLMVGQPSALHLSAEGKF